FPMERRFVRRALLRGSWAAAGGAVVALTTRRGRGAVVVGALAGMAIGGAVEQPAFAVLALPAAVLARRRGRPGLAAVAGAGITAFASTRAWPVAPRTPARIRPALTPVAGEARPDGGGVTFVVNPDAGSVEKLDLEAFLGKELPAARILVLGDDLDLDRALAIAAEDRAIGIAGGDGTVNAAAAVAHREGKPLVVVPAGTLNHLARDLGLEGPEDTVAAVRQGRLVAVDLGSIDGQPFLNTASFGSYSELVDAREQLEDRVGKWPAMVVALVRVLRRTPPVRVELDGEERSLWMVFIGNCRYHPHGFAPTWRERLDDGALDVRLVGAEHPFARVRLVLAVLTGTLGRSAVYEEWTTDSIRLRSLDGPLRLARDGETFDGGADVLVAKEREPLSVYVPDPPR
ncbi:MAG: phosphoesterase PA-phosphatase related, partial [Actinomycetia bacterium]|nr:phosphoesterase PA-phosphatase related [Actinomycetes bacterium]